MFSLEQMEKEYATITPEMIEAEYALLMDKASKSYNPEYDKAWYDNQIASMEKYNLEKWSHKGEAYLIWAKYIQIKSMVNDTYGLRD
jgi:hypothetical protein